MGIYFKDFELYPAVGHREGQFFHADFCDNPDCRGYGLSADEAEAAAAVALNDHMVTLRRDGRLLPTPSSPSPLSALVEGYIAFIAAPLP